MIEPEHGRAPSARVVDAAGELSRLLVEAEEVGRDESRAFVRFDLSDAAGGNRTEVQALETARMVAMNNRLEYDRDGMVVELSA